MLAANLHFNTMDGHTVPPMQKFAIIPKWFEFILPKDLSCKPKYTTNNYQLKIKKPNNIKSPLLVFVHNIRSINSSLLSQPPRCSLAGKITCIKCPSHIYLESVGAEIGKSGSMPKHNTKSKELLTIFAFHELFYSYID